MAGAEPHARVDRDGLHARVFQQANRAEQIREQQPVDHESGHVGNLHGDLLERGAQRQRASPSLLARRGREHELHQLHLANGVEHVQAHEPVLPAAVPRQPLDRQRRGGAREDGLALHDAVELRQQTRLHVVVLHHRLHHECRLSQLLRVGHHLHVRRVHARARPAQRPLDLSPRAPRRAGRAGEQEHRPVMRGGGGQAAGNRSAAGYREAVGHELSLAALCVGFGSR